MRQCRYTTRSEGDVDDVALRLLALWTILTATPASVVDDADDQLLDWVAAASPLADLSPRHT